MNTINITQKTSTQIMEDRMSAGFPGGADRATQAIKRNKMHMTVTIDELRPSKVLPRFKRNEHYDDIKSSIREKGLDHPPNITKIPGEDGYVISDGGNTRLEILNELYQETGDQKFYSIICLFCPWENELKSIIGHLTENGLRDDYTFIEKAVGVSKSKAIYEKELGKTLSSRELSERLKKDGYPVSHVLLSKMLNTIEYIYPYIPEILKQGLGRPQIEKILTLRTVCQDLYRRSGKFIDDILFEEGFNLVLSRFDVEPELFNYEHLQDEVFGYFSRELNIEYNVFEFQLQEKNHKGKTLPPIDVTPSVIPVNENSIQKVDDASVQDKKDRSPKSPLENAKDNPEVPCHVSVSASDGGEIIPPGTDIREAVRIFSENTDFKKLYPKDFSLTANKNTFGDSEKKPILDIWELTEDMTTHEFIFSDIAGHVLDILRELHIDKQAMEPFNINRETRQTFIGFNPLIEEEQLDKVKRTAYQLLISLLTDKTDGNPMNLNYLVSEFSDFVVIKFLRIVRLKRVYDQLLSQFLAQ